MDEEIEQILQALEEDGTSAGATVADHIRTVASNGPEYRTPEAIEEEASALIEAATTLYKPLQDALKDAKAALVGNSNDDEHSALVTIVKALGDGDVPDCHCGDVSWFGEGHASSCPAQAWEKRDDARAASDGKEHGTPRQLPNPSVSANAQGPMEEALSKLKTIRRDEPIALQPMAMLRVIEDAIAGLSVPSVIKEQPAEQLSGLRMYHKWAESELLLQALTINRLEKEAVTRNTVVLRMALRDAIARESNHDFDNPDPPADEHDCFCIRCCAIRLLSEADGQPK